MEEIYYKNGKLLFFFQKGRKNSKYKNISYFDNSSERLASFLGDVQDSFVFLTENSLENTLQLIKQNNNNNSGVYKLCCGSWLKIYILNKQSFKNELVNMDVVWLNK